VPGSVPPPWTPQTALTVDAINSMASDPNQDRMFLLESYHGVIDEALFGVYSTFSWRSRDINLIQNFTSIEYPSGCYDGHDGPIYFYDDTFEASTPGATPSGCLLAAAAPGIAWTPYHFSSFGWFKSMAYQATFLPRITAQPVCQH
jgi:hypothetical protein